MAIEWIFWDNDGVLVETEHLYFQACREGLARVGVDLTPELFARISLSEGRSTFDLALDRGVPPETVRGLLKDRNARYSQLLADQARTAPGVETTLAQLAGKVSMGIVTSAHRDHFEIIHARTGILPYFEFVIAAEDVRRSKPDPEPYLKALALSGAARENCLVVEDTQRGLEAARAAGITCLAIPNGMAADGDYSAAAGILQNVSQVARYVLASLAPPPSIVTSRGDDVG